MRPVYRRPPRRLLREFTVWFIWFLLTGYVFHDNTARDLRALSAAEIALRLASLGVVAITAYWIVAIIPRNVLGFLSWGVFLGFILGGVPFLVQATVTKYLELRQIWP